MRVRGSKTRFRCPALGRASLLLPAVWLAACSYYSRPVEGLPPTAWLDLPLRRWLAEDRAEPLAVAVCRLPECGPDMVVGVVEIHGRDDERRWCARVPEEEDGERTVAEFAAVVEELAGIDRVFDGTQDEEINLFFVHPSAQTRLVEEVRGPSHEQSRPFLTVGA